MRVFLKLGSPPAPPTPSHKAPHAHHKASLNGNFLLELPTYTVFGAELITQFWLAGSQFEISLRVISYVNVSVAPASMDRSSKPRRTTFGSLGPPREMYCFHALSNEKGNRRGRGAEGKTYKLYDLNAIDHTSVLDVCCDFVQDVIQLAVPARRSASRVLGLGARVL